MDKKQLTEKLTSLEQQFNSLQEKKKALQQELLQIDEEALRLSGEYRFAKQLEELLKGTKESKKNG